MGLLLCKCCCPCKSKNSHNSIGIWPQKHLKILLLGPSGSGKTELAHMLTKVKRTDFETTNGSKYYQMEMSTEYGDLQSIGITEIGGSIEMQRIWHHYFPSAMSYIFCFDMSASYEHLFETFQLLEQVLSHSFVRGKSILLIGMKSDLVDEGLQVYDIENSFRLAAMANKYACKLKICYAGKSVDNQNLKSGILWLIKSINENYEALNVRIKGDTNMKSWYEQTNKLVAAGKMKRWSYQRFPKINHKRRRSRFFWKFTRIGDDSKYVRPNTAPAVFSISKSSRDETISWQTSADTINTTVSVPNDTAENDQ